MTQTEQEIEKLKTLNDNYTDLVDLFDKLVPREYVVLTLSVPTDVDWTMYSVIVTNNDKGTSDTYAIPSNGVLEFEVKYDTTYTIKLPVLGNFIAPKDLTFTAGMKMREVGYSYHMVGVFGIDANGKCYTIEQIEALEDKSIIKYGGFTNVSLENAQRDDGTYGCGFMWDIDYKLSATKFLSQQIELDIDLLPFITTEEQTKDYCDGESYTTYITSEANRLGVSSPAADYSRSLSIVINGERLVGFIPSYYQISSLLNDNRVSFLALYAVLNKTLPDLNKYFVTSHQYSKEDNVALKYGNTFHHTSKTEQALMLFAVFQLPTYIIYKQQVEK